MDTTTAPTHTECHALIGDGTPIRDQWAVVGWHYAGADAAVTAIGEWARDAWRAEFAELKAERSRADADADDDRTDADILREAGDLTAAWITEAGDPVPDLRTVDPDDEADRFHADTDWHAIASRELLDDGYSDPDPDDATLLLVSMTDRHTGVVERARRS